MSRCISELVKISLLGPMTNCCTLVVLVNPSLSQHNFAKLKNKSHSKIITYIQHELQVMNRI